jgi:hypothetical protein
VIFYKLVLNRVLSYSEILHWSFPRCLKGQILFLFLTQTMLM